MKLKNIAILLALTGLLPLAALAEPTTGDDAKLVAAGWTAANATFGSLGNVVSVEPELSDAGETLWYRVTMEKGSVIVSPDTEIEPIIAVVPGLNGEIPESTPLRAMLTLDLTARLKSVAALSTSGTSSRVKLAAAPSKNAAKWAKYKARGSTGGAKPKFLTSDGNPAVIVNWLNGWNSPNTEDGVQTLRFWNQTDSYAYFTNEKVFNLYTPNFYPCGCVATAGASVMHYFRVPEGQSIKKNCSVDGTTQQLQSYGGPYDWSLIDNLTLSRGTRIRLSPEQLELLGRVAYDCGVGCEMMYAEDGSGSYSSHLNRSFREVFNIRNAQTVTHTGRDYVYTNDEIKEVGNYDKLIYNQIRAGAPVVLGIDGHEVVACGYGYDGDGTDLTYVFMGWGGSYDAWYQLPVVETQATVGGSGYTSTLVSELVTEISPDENFVAVVGRIVDLDGEPIENYEGLTLPDGTSINVNGHGYWGVRVTPDAQGEIVDHLGQGHAYFVGSLARQTTQQGVAADALAQALPDEMEIVIDAAAAGFLRVYTDLETARRAAWKAGKLLYLIGGTNEEQIVAWKNERREDVGEIYGDFKETHVIVEVSAEEYPELISGEFQAGAFDPRVFNPAGAWDAANGLWDEEVEPWGAVDRYPASLEITGPAVVSTFSTKSYTYEATITFADGLVIPLPTEFATWGKKNDADKRVLVFADGRYTTNINSTDGFFTVCVESAPFKDVSVLAEMDVETIGQMITIAKATRDNGYLLTDSSSTLAKSYKLQIATNGFYQPSTAKALTGEAGTTVYASVKPTYTYVSSDKTKKYKFGCVGYELYKDGQLVEEGTRDDLVPITVTGQPAGGLIGFPVLLDTTDIAIKWKWVEADIWVHVTGAHNVGISEGPQFVLTGETLNVKATPPGGENLSTGYFVWQGVYPREVLDAETAGIVAEGPRTVVVDWVKEGATLVSPNPAETFTAQPGYCVEEVGRTIDGQYVLRVVKAEVEESEATVRIVYPDETIKYYDRVDHAFADVRGACVIELLADQEPTQVMRVYENAILRTADEAASATVTRQAGRFLVDTGATLTVTNVTVRAPLFEVRGGGLTLQKQAILTGSGEEGVEAAAVSVYGAGSVTMEDGSVIEGCRNIAARQEHQTSYPEGPDGGVTNKVTVVFSTGLAGGLLLDGGSTAALRGGRITACEGGTGGGIVALGDSKLDISGDFVVAGNMARETVYEWTTTLIHDPEDDADPTAPDYEPVMIPYDYISGFHQVIVTNNLSVTNPKNCRLTAPLVGGAELGRFTSLQADTNLVATIPAWQSGTWELATLTNTAARCVKDADPAVYGAVVTNASATAYVVWSTAIDSSTGLVKLANGEECRSILWKPAEMAEPEPIAFSLIQMNDDNSVVTLGITNAVKWCNYAVYGTNTLVGGFVIEGTTPVTNFQWKSTEREIKLDLPTNGNLFWRATAAEGLIEE